MGYASFSNTAHFKGDPAEIWDAFANPAVAGIYAEHQTEFFPGPDFALAAGKTWQERHGAECDFDVVEWTITDYVPQTTIAFKGRQSGILQKVRMSMEAADGGWTLVEDIRFSPTVGGKWGTSVVAWIMWATGLLAKFSDDHGDTFDRLRRHLDGESGEVAVPDEVRLESAMVGHASSFVPAVRNTVSSAAADELDGTAESMAAVDRVLGHYGERTVPLSEDDYLRAAAYVFEVARAEFGGRYVEDEDGEAVALVVGEPSCSVTVMALGKVMKRVQHGPADSIEFFYAGIAPLVERGQSAVLR
ncbi:hypothetical protein JOF48_002869 [Arthrobacter stackebrandtii]|uniref:SnoaL-like domain-containing protein n=1 Tax=Arthrobacter stackebrandtii TaxID=272161 RepID=A0ABS4YZ41_9MICC|nr:hypothetical protein [Arthrobacter stackebrandtii]MBP2414070.1 hypothetical protein [Arthrobacter stackebrandtii]PYG99384.1 hypothetical protein CVV67_15835 [Arthrobacter stackebrandtii]